MSDSQPLVHFSFNGEPRQVPPGHSLADLIASLGGTPQALSTAVNGDFVARAARAQCLLREGDSVMTFQPITGG